ncbi:hypothetical protein M0R45_009234 [Rubus argutus]|uniref:Uncharacterized protein n=1 Tax=Rubus argutus TaxID=59490 RepID=A0AAW1Y5F3_RUBAR
MKVAVTGFLIGGARVEIADSNGVGEARRRWQRSKADGAGPGFIAGWARQRQQQGFDGGASFEIPNTGSDLVAVSVVLLCTGSSLDVFVVMMVLGILAEEEAR